MRPRNLHIGLNLLHAMPEIGGGWNYINNLVTALGEYDSNNRYTAFVTEKSKGLVPLRENFEVVQVRINSASRPARIAYENTKLQLLARKLRLDLMHWFANTQALFNSVPSVVTIYDLQPFLEYADYSLAKRAYLRFMMSRTARKARILLPMSAATAADLQHLLNTDSLRTAVIPHIINSTYKPATTDEIAGLKKRFSLPDKFWLYVAHTYRHKNHQRLLQALNALKHEGFNVWPLVLRGDEMGAGRQIRDTIEDLDLERNVFILPRLKETELAVLYSSAAALVFPSLYEGGGIPVIEAMACGCPVLAANIPAVRENAAGAARYFDPHLITDIAEKMRLFQNADQRELCRQAGLERSALHAMEPVIDKLLAAYATAARG